MINIRYPNITGKTEAEQIKQMENYMRYLVDQLNWALGMLEKQQSANDDNNSYLRRQ